MYLQEDEGMNKHELSIIMKFSVLIILDVCL